MFGYIYKTTNLINNKIYVGQHISKSFDLKYKGSGTLLEYAIKKYGWDNFRCEIIEECESLDEMNLKESYWIHYYNSNDLNIGYNLDSGGGHNKQHHQSTKDKMSKSALGKPKSPEHCRNIAKAKLGTTHEPWQQGKIWVMKGEERYFLPPDEAQKYLDQGFKNCKGPRTEESKENMRHRTYITDGKNNKLVKQNELENYLSQGWYIGRTFHDPDRGKGISRGKKGTICVEKDGKCCFIKPELLQSYLDQGYFKSSLVKIKPKAPKPYTPTIFVHNSEVNLRIKTEELPKYLEMGYIEGRKPVGKYKKNTQ